MSDKPFTFYDNVIDSLDSGKAVIYLDFTEFNTVPYTQYCISIKNNKGRKMFMYMDRKLA